MKELALPWVRALGQRRARRLRLADLAATTCVTAVAFTGIAAVVLIFVFVAREAAPLFLDGTSPAGDVLAKLFAPQVTRPGHPAAFVWQPVSGVPKLSVVPLLVGTVKVSLLGLCFAAPVAVAAALFSSQLAPRWLRTWLEPAIELLAGVPSVVIGFFVLMVLATPVQHALGLPTRLNTLITALGVGIAIAPVIFAVAKDALAAVPPSYREASLALGATRWETARRVMLPAAAPGVLAACMLGLGRAVGETMIVLMVSGNAAIVSAALTDPTRTLSATIAAELGEVVAGGEHFRALFFLGVLLFVITFAINLAATSAVRRAIHRMHGAAP